MPAHTHTPAYAFAEPGHHLHARRGVCRIFCVVCVIFTSSIEAAGRPNLVLRVKPYCKHVD